MALQLNTSRQHNGDTADEPFRAIGLSGPRHSCTSPAPRFTQTDSIPTGRRVKDGTGRSFHALEERPMSHGLSTHEDAEISCSICHKKLLLGHQCYQLSVHNLNTRLRARAVKPQQCPTRPTQTAPWSIQVVAPTVAPSTSSSAVFAMASGPVPTSGAHGVLLRWGIPHRLPETRCALQCFRERLYKECFSTAGLRRSGTLYIIYCMGYASRCSTSKTPLDQIRRRQRPQHGILPSNARPL